MTIIRDDKLGGLAMIPLLIDWHVRRCNVKGCISPPSTIVAQLAPDLPLAGFCEAHFQQANQLGGTTFDLCFDDFDALTRVEGP